MRTKKAKTYVVYGHIVWIEGHPRYGKIARVGYTSNFQARNRQHERDARLERDRKTSKKGKKSKAGWYFYRAIRKYGYDKFEMVVLKSCSRLETALAWEAKLISKYRTMVAEGGYNEIPGGQASPMTQPHVIEKMRSSCSKVWEDPAWRAQQGEAARQVWADHGLRERHSETISLAWRDPQLKSLRGALSRELWQRPGVRSAISTTMKRNWSDPERRKRQSMAISNMWSRRPDLKERKSKQVKAMNENPAYRARMSAARAHIYTDPEIKKRHSLATAEAMARPEVKLRVRIGRIDGALHRHRTLLQQRGTGDPTASRIRSDIKELLKRRKILAKSLNQLLQ